MLRCPACRTRRKDPQLFMRHLKESRHRACDCGGYHYPHRPGSPFCHRNPLSAMWDAWRRGESDSVVQKIAESITLESPHLAVEAANLCQFFNLKAA